MLDIAPFWRSWYSGWSVPNTTATSAPTATSDLVTNSDKSDLVILWSCNPYKSNPDPTLHQAKSSQV